MKKGPGENPLSTKERLENILIHGRDGRFVELEYIEGLVECPVKGRIMLVKNPNGDQGYKITVDDISGHGGDDNIIIILDDNGDIREAYGNSPSQPLDNPEEALKEILGLLEKSNSAPEPGYIDYTQ